LAGALARPLRLDQLPEKVLLHLGAEHGVGEVGLPHLLARNVDDVDLHSEGSVFTQFLISPSTPADRSSFMRASSVCCVGSRMSSRRLCVRILDCSPALLFTGGRATPGDD